jgi:hypothetical protein
MGTTVTMLTTVDNPYDPFDSYDEWNRWDMDHGYHTNALLARIAVVSDDLSPADITAALTLAQQEIIEQNVSGMHRVVSRNTSSIQG